jgi:hypothetical protein
MKYNKKSFFKITVIILMTAVYSRQLPPLKKWECLKDELQITKLREGVKEIKQADRRITDNKKVAECFKTHFETCATTLVNSFPDGGQLDLKNI